MSCGPTLGQSSDADINSFIQFYSCLLRCHELTVEPLKVYVISAVVDSNIVGGG